MHTQHVRAIHILLPMMLALGLICTPVIIAIILYLLIRPELRKIAPNGFALNASCILVFLITTYSAEQTQHLCLNTTHPIYLSITVSSIDGYKSEYPEVYFQFSFEQDYSLVMLALSWRFTSR